MKLSNQHYTKSSPKKHPPTKIQQFSLLILNEW